LLLTLENLNKVGKGNVGLHCGRLMVDLNEGTRPISMKILFHFSGKPPSEFLRELQLIEDWQ